MVGSPCSPRTLKSLLQHHSSKASILRCSVFFIVQFSHPYMTTGKTIALTRRTFVGKVMSLLFNMLSRLVITFLPRWKHLNFMAAITICSDFGYTHTHIYLVCFSGEPFLMHLAPLFLCVFLVHHLPLCPCFVPHSKRVGSQ